MNVLEPLIPNYGSGVTLTAGASALSTPLNDDSKSIIITNLGANVAYIRIGGSSSVATTSDYPVLPYSQAVLTKSLGNNTLSYISASGATLHVMNGQGW
jgi:hypothetical protein